jgi:acyl-coenzyme A synthetase/AMP-(fatty) acid ligase
MSLASTVYIGKNGFVCTSLISTFVVILAFFIEGMIRKRKFAVAFYTSGSTSNPKQIIKPFEMLAKEVAFHRKRLAIDPDVVFLATIESHHMYGKLWRELLPNAVGCKIDPDVIFAPEQLLEKMRSAKKVFFVTTPTFLKHFCAYADQYDIPQNCVEIITSGALLDAETSFMAKHVFGVFPQEIFGSTETGGVAWRRQGNSCSDEYDWQVFDPVKVKVDNLGQLVVRSPFSYKQNFVMGDGAELSPDGRRFKLLGRLDRMVKIAEQRVFLPEMEAKIRNLNEVDDVALVPFTGDKGPYIGAVVVVKSSMFKSHDAQSILAMRRLFIPIFPKGTVPKRYRFVSRLPRNPQGKLVASEVKKLFAHDVF